MNQKIHEITVQEKNPITLSWLKGFFEADGGFTASFSGKDLKPKALFSQTLNSNLLPLIQSFLADRNIDSQIYVNPGTTKRAPSLMIQGRHKVMKFINLLIADEPTNTPFLGKTQRQLFVFIELLKDRPEKLTIDEQKQLLQFNRSDGENLSIEETDCNSVKIVKKLYKDHQERVLSKIKSTSKIGTFSKDDFVSGLIDGDGFYAVKFEWKINGLNQYRIRWSEQFGFSADDNSSLTIKGILCHIGCTENILPVKRKRAVNLSITKSDSINSLIDLHTRSSLLGNYTNARFQSLLEYRDLKASGGLKDREKVINFLTHYYKVCEKSRGKFAFTLEKCISILKSDQFIVK